MTDFQLEIILSRILQKEPDCTYEGEWRDCANCYICEKWNKIDITFSEYDDYYFEDFWREIVHKRKKMIFKEVKDRQMGKIIRFGM